MDISSSNSIIQRGNSLIDSFSQVQHMPAPMVIKDLDSRYLVTSHTLANLCGFNRSDECYGITDFELRCDTMKLAQVFIQNDQKVIHKKHELLTLDICKYFGGWKIFIISKKPILNKNNEIIGIFGQAMDVSNTIMFKSCLSLMGVDRKLVGDNAQNVYILSEEHVPLPLTLQQQSCLFLLIRGKSAKEIAAVLDLSSRTVEEHLGNIKTKLKCSSRSQLIEKAIDNGFLNFIPQTLLYKKSVF